ncbi:AMP-binding protein [Nocardioides lianchengensis]|uniref:Fatty-acyl-CoA synthase n=1 Tax=Nocardioides lianchengensis TaxID=1045774 RepID=A0A1G6R5K5_9ACTN|nr:AMP-binding protein [Nocardioides lianchengensis]NYG10368.1 fatty-acyl-CoA synthase [Nocardioides lianchengensis]SDC99564.1 fatty-acyl-CoA synthase [Nocardioides lianchengensis]
MTQTTLPPIEHPTLAGILLARAADDATALLFEDRRWSYRELLAEAAVRAAVLRHLRPEGRPWHVGVLLDNSPEYLFLVAGAALCGASVVGINPTRRGAELATDIRSTDVDTIVSAPEHLSLLAGLDHGAARVLVAGSEEYDALLAGHAGAEVTATPEALDPTTRLLLLFTSGSTGAPKAVVCSTGRMAMIVQLNPLVLERDDVAYNAMPMFHGNALMASWGPCLRRGAAFATRRRFSASGFLPDLQRFGATYVNYVGRSLAYVLSRPEHPGERDNRLRVAFGTEASARDRAEFERRFGCPVVESYGSSEGAVAIRPVDGTPPGALGLPQTGYAAEVLAPDGSVCPPARFSPDGRLLNADEAIGEIVGIDAAARFEGYYRNPEAAAERVRGGDYWTGDLAYRDQDGWFWFAGRTADWLRVDSENFAAAPVERILARRPDVAVAAVYAVPDPRTGDQVMATLQVADDPAGFDVAGFATFLDAQRDLGTKWAPRFLRITQDLPTTATRKVDKPALRRRLWSGDDPVFERVDGAYRPLTADRTAALATEFERHGRAHLLHGS